MGIAWTVFGIGCRWAGIGAYLAKVCSVRSIVAVMGGMGARVSKACLGGRVTGLVQGRGPALAILAALCAVAMRGWPVTGRLRTGRLMSRIVTRHRAGVAIVRALRRCSDETALKINGERSGSMGNVDIIQEMSTQGGNMLPRKVSH